MAGSWPASTAILVAGDRDAILVDALVTRGESEELADWLAGTGKNLTRVYVTHGHGDHFFGVGPERCQRLQRRPDPELSTLLAGDVIYNDIHAWMYQSDHDSRTAWIETLDEVEKLHPATVIAGHTDPGAPDNDGPRLIDQTRHYIRDFDEAVAACGSGQEVVSRITAKYPDLGNPYTLWLAAYTQPYG